MMSFFSGFTDELTKTAAGLLGSMGKTIMKHPMLALTGATTVAGTGMAAASGYRQGLRGGEKPRYLPAGINRFTGEAEPSQASFINYNQLFERKPTRKQIKALSKHYRESAFRR